MSNPTSFEDDFFSVLLSIETAISSLYAENPNLLDFNVDKALNGAVRTLNNRKRDRKPPTLKLKGDEVEMYDRFMTVVDLYRGEAEFMDKQDEPVDVEVDILTYDELIACFKRIQKSIKQMSSQGRQGYLEFIKQFFGED